MFLESLNSKESVIQAQTDTFEKGQLELWFQPVYQRKTGNVLHNEVLLRWRDEQGNLHLPLEFLPSLSHAGMLQQTDRVVIRQATELLAEHPGQHLSLNLSGEGLDDFSLIEYIQTTLDQSGIEPKQLSFELTEAAIAKDFSTVLSFTRELKNLGCSLVLDNFASRDLTLFECQQLEMDLVKVDGQLIQRLKTDPNSRVLTQATLEGVRALSDIAAKFVTDAVTLDLVEEVGLDFIQGHYLKAPSPEPDWTNRISSSEQILFVPVEEEQQPALWWRLLTGSGLVLVALAAAGIGVTSIQYRLTHLNVNTGMVNGKIVRLQSTAEGKVEDFYARPGSEVKSGEVLARIDIDAEPDSENGQALSRIARSQEKEQIRTELDNLELDGQVRVKEAQLAAAKESLVSLNNQLQGLERQNQAVRQLDVQLASETVSQEKAAVEAALAKATAARSEYERYQKLADVGAVSRLQVEQLQSAWQSAEAEVKQVRSELRASQTSFNASKNGVVMDNQDDFESQRAKLLQLIQEQETLVNTLETQVASTKRQLKQAKLLYANLPNQLVEIKDTQSDRSLLEVSAPFSGVIYKTSREQGERISQSEPLLTMLDCNDLWVEAVVMAEDANDIDPNKPVNVRLKTSSEILIGEVELIQPISRFQDINQQTKLREVQALELAIPPKLEGKLLALVTVRIPPTPEQAKSQKFCGIGQEAELTFGKKAWKRG
ncbi:MAG: EAL domain-containing protein [Coleofasciculaceae cyanobacterium]